MQNEAKGKSPDELNDKPFLDDKNFHLAGIIPVAGHKLDFGMEWDESLAPICPNYTLIENAVYECAWAGCDTIWIVVNDDMAPLRRCRGTIKNIFQSFTRPSTQKIETKGIALLGQFYMAP
jgi:hypothetical protein